MSDKSDFIGVPQVQKKEGAAKTEALRGIERDSRGGGQKTPINRGKDGGAKEKPRSWKDSTS